MEPSELTKQETRMVDIYARIYVIDDNLYAWMADSPALIQPREQAPTTQANPDYSKDTAPPPAPSIESQPRGQAPTVLASPSPDTNAATNAKNHAQHSDTGAMLAAPADTLITPLTIQHEVPAPTPAPWPPPCPGRLLSDTMEGILHSYDANDKLVIRKRSEDNTTEAFPTSKDYYPNIHTRPKLNP